MRFLLGCFLTCSLWINTAVGQYNQVPKIIEGTQNGPLLEELNGQYKASLFSASERDFAKTIHNWRLFLLSMQEYAASINFDLKGVKIWLKVYWAKDGSIEHMAYILSDRSINVDPSDLEGFLRSFMRNYKLPLVHKQRFAYDSQVLFPLPYRRQ